jgi:hypothetical protein
MNAEPLLARVAQLLSKHKIDAVLIGNAAAALQGSPVTTVDLDFMFRDTARNLQRLRRLADDMDAVIMRPFYPASSLYRIVRERDGMQLDFMTKIDGIRSFEALRSRAEVVRIKAHDVRVASLETSSAVRRLQTGPKIVPCSPSCGGRCVKRARAAGPKRRKSALRRESDRALVEQIRRLLALPMHKRTNFLRVRHTDGGSHL